MQFTATSNSHVTTARSNDSTSRPQRRVTRKSAFLWSTQSILAVVFLFAGVSKLVMSADTLTQDTWLSAEFLRFIGVAETLGALGLVLPGLLHIRQGLAPLAAAGLAIIMVGATTVTIAAGDAALALYPFAIGVLAAVVAYLRWPATTSPRASRPAVEPAR